MRYINGTERLTNDLGLGIGCTVELLVLRNAWLLLECAWSHLAPSGFGLENAKAEPTAKPLVYDQDQ